jgi:hypothetical protein
MNVPRLFPPAFCPVLLLNARIEAENRVLLLHYKWIKNKLSLKVFTFYIPTFLYVFFGNKVHSYLIEKVE